MRIIVIQPYSPIHKIRECKNTAVKVRMPCDPGIQNCRRNIFSGIRTAAIYLFSYT